MPGRFANLEFNEEARERQSEAVEPAGRTREDEQDYLRKADEAYRSGSFDTALRLYTQSLGQDRKLVAAWVGQVQMLVQLGEYHEARIAAERLVGGSVDALR